MQIDERIEGDVTVLVPHGDVDLESSPKLREALKRKSVSKTPKLLIDFQEVPYIDSSGLATLIEYFQDARAFKGKIALAGMSPRVKSVFEIVRLDQMFPLHPSLDVALASFKRMNSYLSLSIVSFIGIFSPLFGGGRWRFSALVQQVVSVGVASIPTVALGNFLIGVVLAIQGAGQFAKLGSTDLVAGLVSFSVLREIGPLITAVIVIGRSGSAITAELGTMKVSEEIEALTVMGIDPVKFLVVPRLLAMLIMMPALTILGEGIGLFGGWLMALQAFTWIRFITSTILWFPWSRRIFSPDF